MNLYIWIPIVCAVAIVAIYFVWVRKMAVKGSEPKPLQPPADAHS